MSKRCTHVESNGFHRCGSYAFNLEKDGIEQGDLCDVHYWQDQALIARAKLAEQPAQQEPVAWGIIASNTGRLCQVELDADEVEGHNPKHIVPLCRCSQAQREPVPTECRRDGRCQYAIDNGIEGLSFGGLVTPCPP